MKYIRYATRPDHGTRSGYDWHKRQDNSTPCEPCRQALADYWRTKRIERRDTINQLRALWRKNNPHAHKPSQVKLSDLIFEYGTICYLCDLPIDLDAPRQVGVTGWEQGLHMDHVIPRSKGGADTLINTRPTHARCNLEKWSKL